MFDLFGKGSFMKRIQAPDWFIKMKAEADSMRIEMDKVLGTEFSAKDFEERLQKASEEGMTQIALDEMQKLLKKNGKLPTNEQMHEVVIIQQYMEKMSELGWARFRFENRNTAFGRAAQLKYLEKEGVIEITK